MIPAKYFLVGFLQAVVAAAMGMPETNPLTVGVHRRPSAVQFHSAAISP
jgi:hypothetical protein